MSLKGRRILLGITGSIAAFKAAELVRMLTGAGCEVRVVITAAGARFVGPLTFAALTNNPVSQDLFSPDQESRFSHLDLAQWADVAVVAPATANTIGKIAAGIADDLLSTVLLAVTSPVLVCPAMNQAMFKNPMVQANLKRLKEFGVEVVGPARGDLACGEEGEGRLSDPGEIIAHIERALSPGLLKGFRVLVSAGPTREFLDPVRFISNPSTGKMGFALARAAWTLGAEVSLVTGPSFLGDLPGVSMVRITSARGMKREVEGLFEDAHAVIMASAVSDFRPLEANTGKVKKEDASLTLDLARNPDILASLGQKKGERVLVGFAAESEDLRENARKKLKAKNLDFIVANDITNPQAGFETDTNLVTILYRDGQTEEFPLMSKHEVAQKVVARVARLLEEKSKP